MRMRIVVQVIAAALTAVACLSPSSTAGSPPSSASTGSSSQAASPLDGTWTSTTQKVPELVKIISASGIRTPKVRPWVSAHLDPAPYIFTLRFLEDQFSQFQGTDELSSGSYRISGDSLTWTESGAGCAVTVPFYVSGSTLTFGAIEHEGCATADSHMAYALFFGETYGKVG